VDTKARQIIKRIEDHIAYQASLVKPVPVPVGPGLDSEDSFGPESFLTMDRVKRLKTVLTDLTIPVNRDDYHIVWEAKRVHLNQSVVYTRNLEAKPEDHKIETAPGKWKVIKVYHTETGYYLISDEESRYLSHLLDAERKDLPRTLPDRDLTVEEKARIVRVVQAFKANMPQGTNKYVKIPVRNGMDSEDKSMPDTAVHRRLWEIYKELEALEKQILPEPAKDETKLTSYWSVGAEWKSRHYKSCHYCGHIHNVEHYNWEEKPTEARHVSR